jgi:hypothetical protein
MSFEASETVDQAVLRGRGLALAVDLSAGHAAIYELAVLPDRIDACGNRRDAGVRPSCKRKARGELISCHPNTSVFQE